MLRVRASLGVVLAGVVAVACAAELRPARVEDAGLSADMEGALDTALPPAVDAGVDALAPEDVTAPEVLVVDLLEPDAAAEDVPEDLPARDVPRVDGARSDAAPRDAPGVDGNEPGRRDPPPLRAYTRGACPMLVGGATAATSVNTGFRSGSQTRSFRLLVPRSYDGRGEWPLVFAWHWLNASSGSFVRDGELERATEQMRFLAVLPDRLENSGRRAYFFDWPFAETWGAPGELTFFDDLLACVAQQYRVDRRRVYAVGVSAGALWVTYLSTTDRANYLAAVESLSGGLGEEPFVWRMEFVPQANKFPALVLWGGPSDWLGLSFDQASRRYRDALLRDRHFVVTCVHSMGHAMPPLTAPPGGTRFQALWQFFLDHPYGMAPGDSPWLRAGLPSSAPPWCMIAR